MPLGLDANFYRAVLPLIIIETGFFAYAFNSDLRTCQVVLGLVGLWWCFAALWVEIKIEQAYPGFQYDNPVDPAMKAYRPFCDFAPWAHCSKVLMSPPGRFLRLAGISKPLKEGTDAGLLDKVRSWIDVPNPTLGVLFFSCHLFYPALLSIPVISPWIPWLAFAACCLVGLMTVWLAYTLFFVLKDLCIVCVSMYIANFALVPMMYGICKLHKTRMNDFIFWGALPRTILYPFLALDVFMLIAVLALYFSHHSPRREAEGYMPIAGEARHP